MTHVDVAKRYLDGWIRRDADAVLATLTPDGTYEDPPPAGLSLAKRSEPILRACGRPFSGSHFEVLTSARWGRTSWRRSG